MAVQRLGCGREEEERFDWKLTLDFVLDYFRCLSTGYIYMREKERSMVF